MEEIAVWELESDKHEGLRNLCLGKKYTTVALTGRLAFMLQASIFAPVLAETTMIWMQSQAAQILELEEET